MSELPRGWEWLRLREIVSRTANVDPSKHANEIFELYSVPSHATGAPELLFGRDIGSTKQIVEPGDVLLCKIIPHLVRVWVVPPRSTHRQIASGEWIVYRDHCCDANYLRFALMEPLFREQFMRTISGVGGSLTRAKPEAVAEISIPLPPLPEQHRIVTKLDTLLAGVARARKELDRVPILIAHHKQALLATAFSGELTRRWREQRGENPPETVTLRDVAEDFSYGSAAKSDKVGKVPVLRMGNIQNGRLDWEKLVFTSDDSEIEKYTLKRGDVLFNRTNSPELVGKTALYDSDRKAIYAGYLIRVRCSDRLNPAFLAYCLNSPAGRAYSWKVKADAVSQSNINAKKLAAFQLPLPRRDEQDEIVRKLDAAISWLDAIASEQGRAAKLLPKLEQAILVQAFRGELVPQDPADEPASVLLERIRAGRAAPPETPKKSKSPSNKKGTAVTPKAQLENELASWPDSGLTFEELAQRVSGDYDLIRDGIFELMSGPSPKLNQKFDYKERVMRIYKVAA